MNDYLPLYAVFSVVALVLKGTIAFLNLRIAPASPLFWALFGSLFGVNFFELVGFYYPSDGRFAYVLLSAYYLSLVAVSASLLAVSLDTAIALTRHVSQALFVVFGLTALTFAIPGLALSGVETVGYTSTRIAGPFYWIFQTLFPLSFLISTLLLVWGARRAKTDAKRRKSKALAIAIFPMFVAAVVIVALMNYGVAVTGSVVGSFVILIFLLVLMLSEDEHRLFEFLSYVPATTEFRLASRAREVMRNIGQVDLPTAVGQFEKALINEALSKSKGNKTIAADMLGVSRTTLRRKLDA